MGQSTQKRGKPMNTAGDKDKPYAGPEGSKARSTDVTSTLLSSNTDQAGGANLEKVREILFGAQSREYQKRFANLEERLLREATEVKHDLKKRFDTLEAYIKKEVEALTEQVKSEHIERSSSLKDLSREIRDLTKLLEKRVGQLDEQGTKTQRDLRNQILDQYRKLADEIQDKHAHISKQLEKTAKELRHEKTDRASLAAFFMEAAMRLNNEFTIPGVDKPGASKQS